MHGWIDIDDCMLPAASMATPLLELAQRCGVETQRLLAGTRLFPEPLTSASARLSAAQLLRLIDNAQRMIPGADASFLLGHQLLPGNCGALSMALVHAANLQQALHTLVRANRLFSPLLRLELRHTAGGLELSWIDRFGLDRQRTFVIEAMSTAISSLGNWLAGERLPWQFDFAHRRPGYIEQYDVHLSSQVRFAAPLDRLRIAEAALHKPWLRASPLLHQQALQRLDQDLAQLDARPGFRELIHDRLLQQLSQPPSLDRSADDLHMSPASLKRRLQRHRCSHQSLIDELRLKVSTYLLCEQGYSNEQLADHLQFTDINNFRRSFKRWSGATPSAFRSLWAEPAGPA